MSTSLVPTAPKRRLARRLSPVLLVVAMVAAVLGFGASPASAAAKWNSGSTKYTTITNCPSIIWGSPYQEFGIGAFVSYWGDQNSNPITPAVGETTYLDTYAMLVGSHCSTPFIFPRFVLPGGVEFDRTQAIKCYYTPPGGTQYQITDATECPQWAKVSANGYYSNSKSGWNTGWPLPSGQNFTNGSAWEFLVPVRATSQVFGAQLTTELSIADGNAGPTLNLTVPFYTGAPPVTAPGAPTNVTANATSATSAQVSFNAPANNGGAAITGYTARCVSPSGGVTQTANGNAAPINVTGLSPDQTYSCDVRATNNAGSGNWSNASANFSTPSAATKPGAPTGVTASVVSKSSARVSFTPPADNGGSAITEYRAKCVSSDGGTTRGAIGTGSPITVNKLTSGARYRCSVKATNAVGSTPSTSSPRVLVAVAPGAPGNVVATVASPTSATVAFAVPADNGGSPITSYRVKCTSSDGGAAATQTGASSPLTVSSLTTGKRYKCYVGATNAVGTTYSAHTPAFVVR